MRPRQSQGPIFSMFVTLITATRRSFRQNWLAFSVWGADVCQRYSVKRLARMNHSGLRP